MGFKCGLVGLPNVGKSTIFNALTKGHVASENYPFCTIDPHIGIVHIPDPRLTEIAKIINPQKIIPTTMEFIDIAGLVAGAHKGEGLGNQFLSHIRETDAIAHVVRCFEDDNIIHVAGKVDPLHDIEIIETELILADLQTVEKALLRATKNSKAGQKEWVLEKNLLTKVLEHLNQEHPVRTLAVNSEESECLRQFNLLTNKPIMYIANVNGSGLDNNPLLDRVREYAKSHNAETVSICAAIEAELVDLSPEDQAEFLTELGISEPGLNQVIRTGYRLLNLQTYFTAGVKEVRAWTINKGNNAQQAAGKIHSDFVKGFIRAEVIAYNDFIQYKGEAGAKEAGKWRLEGKEYIVNDGDIMHFRFNV